MDLHLHSLYVTLWHVLGLHNFYILYLHLYNLTPHRYAQIKCTVEVQECAVQAAKCHVLPWHSGKQSVALIRPMRGSRGQQRGVLFMVSRARQFYGTGSLYVPGHTVKAEALRHTVKGTPYISPETNYRG
jgi:hypothetical protein